MEAPRNYSQRQLKVPIAVIIFLFTFAILPSKSEGRIVSSYMEITTMNNKKYDHNIEMKSVLGSKPPNCTNRCMSCEPCNAVVAVPPHTKHVDKPVMPLTPVEEEPYYLVTWKCKCNDNLFPP